jgi:CheY-like chemotaxis protein
MGGNINVESEFGKGSTFSFKINMVIGEQKDKPWEIYLRKPANEFKILILEDNPQSAASICKILNTWGIQHKTTANVEESLDLLEQEGFDLVLIDYYLNDLQGDEVAQLMMRLMPKENKPRIVLLAPSKASIDILKVKKEIHFDFLTKPLLQHCLRNYLHEHFGLHEAKSTDNNIQPNLASKTEQSAGTKTILVAEDQIINRKIVVQLLEKKGYKVKAVENGREAFELAVSQRFDLILMDVQMPEMDGFDSTQHIRTAEKNKNYHTPIVAMTAHAMKGDREKCLAAGMDHYITKPINPAELYETIEKFAP